MLITPTGARLLPNAQQQYTATEYSGTVTWSCLELLGTITRQGGLLTCGTLSGTYGEGVRAISPRRRGPRDKYYEDDDDFDSDAAGVFIIVPPIAGTVGPRMNAGQTQTFSAGAATGLVWSISGRGQIDPQTGVYTAPSTTTDGETCTVRATSADGTLSETYQVTFGGSDSGGGDNSGGGGSGGGGGGGGGGTGGGTGGGGGGGTTTLQVTGPTTVPCGSTTDFNANPSDGVTFSLDGRGQLDAQTGIYTAPSNITTPETVLIRATRSGTTAQLKVTVEVTPSPYITGTYQQTYAGGSLQFAHVIADGQWSSDTGDISASGLFRPSSAGLATITYTPPPNKGCAARFTLLVFPALKVTPQPDAGESLSVTAGETVQFTATGGSGNFIWTSGCGGGIRLTQAGRLTTPPNVARECSVSVTDRLTGQVLSLPLLIVAATLGCVQATPLAADDEPECCQHTLDAGESIQLAMPACVVNRVTAEWQNIVLAQRGSLGELTAVGPGSVATEAHLLLRSGETGRVDVALTPAALKHLDMSTADFWAIGFTSEKVETWRDLDIGLGVDGQGQLLILEAGIVRDLVGEVVLGDVLSIEIETARITYSRNGIAIGEASRDLAGEGVQLAVTLPVSGSGIGGPFPALWRLRSVADEVGTVTANGLYTAPQRGGFDVLLEAKLGRLTHTVQVRVTEPTLIPDELNSFFDGPARHVWLNVTPTPPGQTPRLARDGSPDRSRNPKAVHVGETADGHDFSDEPQFSEFKGDSGFIYKVKQTGRRVQLKFKVLQIRNLDRLQLVLPGVTIKRVDGGRQLHVGGQFCQQEITILLVKEADGGGFDTLELFKCVARGGLKIKAGTDGRGEAEAVFEVIPDRRRPINQQLYTLTLANPCQ